MRQLLVALVLLSSFVPACAHSGTPPVASPAAVTSVILDKLEELINTYSQDEIRRAQLANNKDWEETVLRYWSDMYYLLIAANQAYTIVIDIDRASGDEGERMKAIACYALHVKTLAITLIDRGFYVPGFIKRFAEKASALEESQCQSL